MTMAVRARDLCKHFRGGMHGVDALNGLTLDVPEASVFGLIGPNGAGKSTALKILLNIIQPGSGTAEVLGTDSRRLGAADLARIGYVSENQRMPDWMTVDYFLRYLKPFYPSWDDDRAAELVRQFDLPGGRTLRSLSRGMRMKAALVSSLAYRPRLLVLDEPFSGLDPAVREDLIEGLIESAAETTILIASHDLGDIESFASHAGYLDGGRLRFAEEMTSLTKRFREVEVVLGPETSIAAGVQWPATWTKVEAEAAVIRFVETQFDEDRTAREVRSLLGGELQVSVNPMSLRAIFVALARTPSKAA